MGDRQKSSGGSGLLGFLLGGITGGALVKWWLDHQAEEDRKSRAEQDDPEFLQEVLEVLDGFFKRIQFQGDFKDERHIMVALARRLDKVSEFEIEVEPVTPHGKPDILVGAAVALELKKGLTKAEMDRCVSQCAEFAKQWFTIILVFDTPSSMVQRLENHLHDLGLEHIPVVHYA